MPAADDYAALPAAADDYQSLPTASDYDALPAAKSAFPLDPNWEEKQRLARAYSGPESESAFLSTVANAASDNPKQFSAEVIKAVPQMVMAPFSAAGQILNAGVQDAMTTAAGKPEYGGNVYEFFNRTSPAEAAAPMPYQQTLADISSSHPKTAIAGKVAAGTVESAPIMAAGIPAGVTGKLISLGFSADMIRNGGEAATRLGEEMGKPPSQRSADKITSSVADLLQAGAFAPLAGAHGTKEAVMKSAAIAGLSARLLSEPKLAGEIRLGNQRTAAFQDGGPAEDLKSPAKTISEFGGETESDYDALPNAVAAGTTPAPPETGQGEIPPSTTILQPKAFPVVEVPLKELSLSKDVPNFKADADEETGVVQGQKLEGDYERLGTGAITVYERLDGSREVISGRHRFDLAKRADEESIPSQIVREADGFTPQMAQVLDAEMNIRDGQGSVSDYANYFRQAEIDPGEAASRGLLARQKGKAGWTIGRNLSDDAFALYRAGKINEGQAVAIGKAAPLSTTDSQLSTSLQRVGVKAALDGKSPLEISNFVQAVKLETRNLPPEQFDLFAADDSALKEAERLAMVASRIQTELSREIRATDAAAKNATTAKAKGLKFERPPEEILADNAKMKGERDAWENWALDPSKVQQVRDYAAMDRSHGIIKGSKIETWADNVIGESRKRVNTGIDPELLAAYAVKGAALIEQGIHDFGDWSKAMLQKHGEKIRSHLDDIYREAKFQLAKRFNERTLESRQGSAQESRGRARGNSNGGGYVDYSMSVRANNAYSAGKLPASKAAKELGISTQLLRSLFRPSEWHHTSKFFNATDFFDMNEIWDMVATDPKVSLEIRKGVESAKKKTEWWNRAVEASLHRMRERIGEDGPRATPLAPVRSTPTFNRLRMLSEKFGATFAEAEQIAKTLNDKPLTETNYDAALKNLRVSVVTEADLSRRQSKVEALLPQEYRRKTRRPGNVEELTNDALKRYRPLARMIAEAIPENEISPDRVRMELAKANAVLANGAAGIKTPLITSSSAESGASGGTSRLDEALKPANQSSSLQREGGALQPEHHTDSRMVGSESIPLEQKLDKLKIDTNGQLHAFGLLPEAWNALIDFVKLGIKGGRAASAAIDWAIEQIKTKFPEQKFDEPGARTALAAQFSEGPARQRVQKILSDETVSPAVKAGVAPDLAYTPRGFESIEDEARAIIQQHGIDDAEKLFTNPRALIPLDTRQALGAQLQDHFRTQERLARAKGDTAQSDYFAGKQVALWKADAYGTELAQGLNARKLYDAMSPAGMLRQAKELFGEQSEKQWNEKLKPAADTVKETLTRANNEAIEDVRNDKQVGDAARAAVEEKIVSSPETHHAIVMELAEPFAQSSAILAHAREAVRAKVDELLNQQPRPPGMNLSQAHRVLLNQLAERAVSIANGHYQNAEPGVTLKEKLQQRLGLNPEAAARMARQMDTQFAKMVEAAKMKLKQRIATQRAQRDLPFDPNDPHMPAVDREIRKQLREMNVNLGKAVEQHRSVVDATGKTLGDRVVQASGLNGEMADKLRDVFDRRFQELATQRKRAALEQLDKLSSKTVSRQIRSQYDKLIRLTNLGAFEDAKFYDLIKKNLDLPVMTDELAREITKRANDLEKLPEGNLRDRAATDLLNYVQRQRGLKLIDLPMGIFYSNVLSGLTTPAKIAFENTGLLVGNTITSMLTRPRDVLGNPVSFFKTIGASYGRGLKKGGLLGAEILKTGITTGVKPGLHPSSVMELKPFGEKLEPLNLWKYVMREISAVHVSTFKPAMEIKQSLIARDVARREGLTGAGLDQRVADLMANTEARVSTAQAQAAGELAALGNKSKIDYRRRVDEILDQQREVNMPGSTELARDFALRSTYLNEPYGFLGLIAEGVRSTLERGRKEFPILGTAAKTQIPFTTIVANILNEKLNWTPVGAARAGVSLKTGKLYGRELLETSERSELLAKSIVGTVALGTLATFFGQQIHGNGPAASEKRKQLQAAGWIPHSIKIGNKYYSYMNTPAAVGLAVIGNWMDWHRYGKGNDADGVSRAAFVTKATANAIVQQGMLDSLRRIFDALGSDSTTDAGDKLQKLGARTASAFVVPNLLQQLDRFWDPKVYDQTGMKALLTSQLPIVRRENRPALNVLGEPIKSDPFHYWASAQSKDPVWRTIVEKQAFISEPRKDEIVGDKKRGPDHYRAMTPSEYYSYVGESGRAIREQLTRNLDRIRDMESDQAQAYVRRIVEHERAKVRRKFSL